MSNKTGSLLLVVDADILRAAGDSRGHASKTREMLEDIRQICHRVILSGKARREWDKQVSRFSRTWWLAMQNRGKIQPVELQLDTHVRDLGCSGLEPERLPKLRKDLHLVVAALEHGDRIVISNEKRAPRGFAGLSSAIPAYGKVKWWGPDCPIPSHSASIETRADSS